MCLIEHEVNEMTYLFDALEPAKYSAKKGRSPKKAYFSLKANLLIFENLAGTLLTGFWYHLLN